MLVGILGAIAQDDIKRLLSFTLVSHIGYLLFGVAVGNTIGLSGAIFYVAHHILIQTTLFLVVGLVEWRRGTTSLTELGGLARTGPAAILSAVRPVAGPAILLGGTATLVGCLLDLAVRLRTSISAEAARGVAFTVGGLALTLVAAAGAVAAGSLPGTAARVGSVGVLLVLAGVLALARGLRELGRTRELSGTGGILTVLAVLAVLGGALLAPADALLTAISLAALLSLAGVLGAVTGLCGAAALVRLPRRERIPSRVLPGLRARLTQAPRS